MFPKKVRVIKFPFFPAHVTFDFHDSYVHFLACFVICELSYFHFVNLGSAFVRAEAPVQSSNVCDFFSMNHKGVLVKFLYFVRENFLQKKLRCF